METRKKGHMKINNLFEYLCSVHITVVYYASQNFSEKNVTDRKEF